MNQIVSKLKKLHNNNNNNNNNNKQQQQEQIKRTYLIVNPKKIIITLRKLVCRLVFLLLVLLESAGREPLVARFERALHNPLQRIDPLEFGEQDFVVLAVGDVQRGGVDEQLHAQHHGGNLAVFLQRAPVLVARATPCRP